MQSMLAGAVSIPGKIGLEDKKCYRQSKKSQGSSKIAALPGVIRYW